MELEYVGSYLYRGLIIVKISYIGAHRERNISHRYALLSSCRRVSMLDCLRQANREEYRTHSMCRQFVSVERLKELVLEIAVFTMVMYQ